MYVLLAGYSDRLSLNTVSSDSGAVPQVMMRHSAAPQVVRHSARLGRSSPLASPLITHPSLDTHEVHGGPPPPHYIHTTPSLYTHHSLTIYTPPPH